MPSLNVFMLRQSVVRSLSSAHLRKPSARGLLTSRFLPNTALTNASSCRVHIASASATLDQFHSSQRVQHRSFLPSTLCAALALCGASAYASQTQCEEEQQHADTTSPLLYPVHEEPNRRNLMQDESTGPQQEYEEQQAPSRDEKDMMASSMMHLPLPMGESIPDASEPMFAVQRLRRLNGWAALEAKEDLKKVELARLLNDLYKLTKEHTTENEDDDCDDNVEPEDDTFELEQEFHHEAEVGLSFDPDKESINKEHTLHLIQQLQNGHSFKAKNFIRLIDVGARVLKNDATLVDLSHKQETFVVGDLHGSNDNLQEVLKIVGDLSSPEKAIVFNGDFVDRGKRGVEVVCTLILLKITYPDNVFLVRGNHEDSLLATIYGFEEEVRDKYGRRALKDVWAALGNLFAALPWACKTKHAAIMHGGIPSEDFSLEQLEKIPFETRSTYSSVMDEDLNSSETETLCRDVMWSDPMIDQGLHDNENRGLGKAFGTDVSKAFLERHGLNYLIRSHEVMDDGWDVIDCGNNRYVLTVFSTSAYPDGFGDNKGAILRLNSEAGKLDPIEYMIEPKTDANEAEERSSMVSSLVHVIVDNKAKLQHAFEKIESNNGTVSIDQWAKLMESELEMDMDWLSLQHQIAPTKLEETDGEFHNTNQIDWREFLELNCFSGPDVSVDDDTMESLFSNHDMLLTVFRYLDTDGNGKLDEEEFVSGITLLNERLPESRQFKDPLGLFKTLDFDGSGEIDLDEFAAAFNVVSKPPDRAVLSTIFNSLDTDNSGTVDIDEFRVGVAKLNERLPRDRQVKDADALFKSLDLNGDGEVDVHEFSAFYF